MKEYKSKEWLKRHNEDVYFEEWLKIYQKEHFDEFGITTNRTESEKDSYLAHLRKLSMSEFYAPRNKKIAIWSVAILLLVVGLFFVGRHNNNTFSAKDLEGEANIFPTDTDSKNYRVKTYWDISSTPYGFNSQKRTYDLKRVEWPNGGYTEFPECTLVPLEGKNTCEDIDFRQWRIEIHKEPLY